MNVKIGLAPFLSEKRLDPRASHYLAARRTAASRDRLGPPAHAGSSRATTWPGRRIARARRRESLPRRGVWFSPRQQFMIGLTPPGVPSGDPARSLGSRLARPVHD